MSGDTIRGDSRHERRRRAVRQVKAPATGAPAEPTAPITRFRTCECVPLNLEDHAECVKEPTP